MNRNNIIVKFNDDELNIIKENVHSIYNKILNIPLNKMFYKIIAAIILTLGFLAIIIAIGTLLVTVGQVLLTKLNKNFFEYEQLINFQNYISKIISYKTEIYICFW